MHSVEGFGLFFISRDLLKISYSFFQMLSRNEINKHALQDGPFLSFLMNVNKETQS